LYYHFQFLVKTRGLKISFNLLARLAGSLVKKANAIFKAALVSYPKKVQCNICGWEGRHFASDPYHKHTHCPSCGSDIRHRLFFAALQNTEKFSFKKLIINKTILHFAPERIVSQTICNNTEHYITADFLRKDCDLKLDMSNMPEIENGSVDTVIAFDVLEHLPDYKKALEEVNMILSPGGFGIFTVPQKDNLLVTYEDSNIVTPDGRTEHFGQWDHLRIFGDDFSSTVESKGFTVIAVDESMFSENLIKKHVLFPPLLSKHPLATNFRKIFFCQKT